jgi:hypothetical protein
MEAYMYRAAFYCSDCAHEIGMVCHIEHHGRNFSNLCDSECTPIGAYPDGGGEADTPQHCDTCREFLENPLTDDGREYVREAIEQINDWDTATVTIWREFYGDTLDELAPIMARQADAAS